MKKFHFVGCGKPTALWVSGFWVKAVWDGNVGIFVSSSNITGLHIEAETLLEFGEELNRIAPKLIEANHKEK